MMPSQNDLPPAEINGSSQENTANLDDLYTLVASFKQAQQNKSLRLFSKEEKVILTTITNCLTSWYEPWRRTFLSNACEFKTIYKLMEDLIHYEDQITKSEPSLSGDRITAIAHAVARLVDLGNAVLNMDLVVRANNELSSELDPTTVTTLELLQSHVKAHNLREKLLNNYFKKNSRHTMEDTSALSNTLLQVPSPKLERAHRTSIGSNTSINTIVNEGRKTPQPKEREIEVKLQNLDLTLTNSDMNQLEMTHILGCMRGIFFLGSQSSTTRLSVLPKIINKIKSLLIVPTSAEKLGTCFELLSTMLSALERLPIECRSKEVDLVAKALLQPIVRKVYIDDRDNIVEFQHAHWTTCLLSIVRLMTAAGFSNYLKHFNNSADLSAFLKDYLFIVKRIISSSGSDKNVNSPASIQLDLVDSLTNQHNSPFPDCWIEMTLLASSTFLTSLTYLYQILRQYFSSNLQMWYSFIDSLIYFILQDAIKSDRSLLKSRQRMLAENLRQTAAEYIWISWDSLSQDQKQQLMDDLIEPLLKACISLDSRQRSILLPIFYGMMRCDFTSQYVTPRGSVCSLTIQQQQQYTSISGGSNRMDSYLTGLDTGDSFYREDDLESLPPLIASARGSISQGTNESLPYLSCRDVMNSAEDGTVLTKFTHLVVGKLNSLMIDLNMGNSSFKQELCAALAGELNPKYFNRSSSKCDTTQFKSLAKHTADLIAEFMQICLDLREANQLFYNDLKLLCLFKLILFFRDKVDRPELYLSNLFKLCYLQHTAGRYIEAGYTLLEHAKQLNWSPKPIELHCIRLVTRFFQTPSPLLDQSSLKAFLYLTIIEYFDQGQLWEAAAPLCRELIDLYQYKTYEYQKLVQILQKLSGYFSNIVESNGRSFAEYFRVTFYGCGFPKALRNVTMVFRGRPFEKLGDFQKLMLNEYTEAKLLATLARPEPNMLEEHGAKYLQINACSPLVDLKSKFSSSSDNREAASLPEIEESILNYYRYNECDKFTFSRRISGPPKSSGANGANDSDNFANMWRERTTLSTNTLPGMLSFFPVYLLETSTVSPIESAIEDLERTNDRLSCMVNRFRADKRQAEDIRLLGQLLLGIVDAAVNGGITKYEQAFFAGSSSSPSSSSSRASGNHSHSHNHNHNKQSPENSLINHLGAGAPADDQQLLLSSSTTQQQQQAAQVDKLKCLIGQQLPLLDEAIRLHRDRVADVMRPQHEHLEASYKKLKHHVMSKYSRHLPQDYNRSTMRSFRSLTRSPNRSMRLSSTASDSISAAKLPSLMMMSQAGTGRLSGKRMSDAGPGHESVSRSNRDTCSSIPYKQLQSERRSLPFLPGVPVRPSKASPEEENINQDEEEEDDDDDELGLNDGGGELVVIPPPPERPVPVPVAQNLIDTSTYVELEPNLKPSMLLSLLRERAGDSATRVNEGTKAEEELVEEEKLVTF